MKIDRKTFWRNSWWLKLFLVAVAVVAVYKAFDNLGMLFGWIGVFFKLLTKKKENGKFGILTEALDCTIRRNDKLSEGIVEIVVCDHHEEEIKEELVRILTVSLI